MLHCVGKIGRGMVVRVLCEDLDVSRATVMSKIVIYSPMFFEGMPGYWEHFVTCWPFSKGFESFLDSSICHRERQVIVEPLRVQFFSLFFDTNSGAISDSYTFRRFDRFIHTAIAVVLCVSFFRELGMTPNGEFIPMILTQVRSEQHIMVVLSGQAVSSSST